MFFWAFFWFTWNVFKLNLVGTVDRTPQFYLLIHTFHLNSDRCHSDHGCLSEFDNFCLSEIHSRWVWIVVYQLAFIKT